MCRCALLLIRAHLVHCFVVPANINCAIYKFKETFDKLDWLKCKRDSNLIGICNADITMTHSSKNIYFCLENV